MGTNSRLASAVQVMTFVAYIGNDGTTSEAIARSLQTNPVVVRRLLKSLEKGGLVSLRRGRAGGVDLGRPARQISLGQIYRAVESDDPMFSLRDAVNPRCPVAHAMQFVLPPAFETADAAVEGALNQITLAAVLGVVD